MTKPSSESWDDAVVGAGILGLAHAYHLARRGRRVIVFERNPRALGASIRNFGMLWPIGQPRGELYDLARRSLEIWLRVLRASGLWHDQVGSLHLAYREDEAQVLREFAGDNRDMAQFLDDGNVLQKSHAVKRDGLLAGLWSPHETCVDPRSVVTGLPPWLAREHGVQFRFGCAVTAFAAPYVHYVGGVAAAEHLWICSGDDFRSLFPETLQALGLMRCKLQMMRSQPVPDHWRLGPMLAGGLTLRHYAAFANCPSLPDLKKRIAAESPNLDRYGIHVLTSQNQVGELIMGDSHEYDDAIEPFDKRVIDDLILRYLHTLLDVPSLHIAAHWHGTYAKHPRLPFVVACPTPHVTAVTGVGGAGMTLSFGLAEKVVADILDSR